MKMAIIGCNLFDQPTGDDEIPYSYILQEKVTDLLLVDGNSEMPKIQRELIPLETNITFIEGVVLPNRFLHLVGQEGLYYFSTFKNSGGNFYGSKDECIKRKNTYTGKHEATIEKVPEKTIVTAKDISDFNPDFLQIDIEGHDLELLTEVIVLGCRPNILIYEHHYQSKDNIVKFDQLIKNIGYASFPHTSNKVNMLYKKLPSDFDWKTL